MTKILDFGAKIETFYFKKILYKIEILDFGAKIEIFYFKNCPYKIEILGFWRENSNFLVQKLSL